MKIDMQAFCHTGNSRYALCSPFVNGGYLCASDGRIMIRMKTDLPDETEKNLPKIQEIFDLATVTLDEPILMELPCFTDEPCSDCRGFGNRHMECDSCDGEGDHECGCGTAHECGQCDGTGRICIDQDEKCETCKGSCKSYKNVDISGVYITGIYATLIVNNLPSPHVVAYQPPESEHDPSGMIRFTFDGGEGVMMGRTSLT